MVKGRLARPPVPNATVTEAPAELPGASSMSKGRLTSSGFGPVSTVCTQEIWRLPLSSSTPAPWPIQLTLALATSSWSAVPPEMEPIAASCCTVPKASAMSLCSMVVCTPPAPSGQPVRTNVSCAVAPALLPAFLSEAPNTGRCVGCPRASCAPAGMNMPCASMASVSAKEVSAVPHALCCLTQIRPSLVGPSAMSYLLNL